jgi:hypothetical protein
VVAPASLLMIWPGDHLVWPCLPIRPAAVFQQLLIPAAFADVDAGLGSLV